MAVVVLLLLVLFTEVLGTAAAGVRVNGAKNDSGGGSHPLDSSRLSLEIRPRGSPLVLGRRGITLTCVAGGLGLGPERPEIVWLYNGEPVLPDKKKNGKKNDAAGGRQVAAGCGPARCSLLPNGSLRLYKRKNSIVQKTKGREGGNEGTLTTTTTITAGSSNERRHEYRCIAKTSSGASIRSAPTNVLYAELAHAFEESPKDSTVREGEVSRLSCNIDSVPYPSNITWIHDGEIVPIDFKTKYTFVPPNVLYIAATKHSDAGSYRCVATNVYLNVTKKSKEAKLTVVSVRDENNEESSKSVSLYPQTAYRHTPLNGTNLRLACAASGYPTPTTSWTFVPQSAADTKAQRLLINSNSGLAVLELKKVTATNAGVYTCSMKNSQNSSTLDTQVVTVEVLSPPTFIKKPLNQVCPNGRTARFECQAQGYPTPRIYWLRNSTNITIDGRRTVYVKEFNKMELAISATVPSDSGIYQCVAVNSVGEVWAAGRLQVNTSRNSPAAPTTLTCEARSPVKMYISWEPPKFLPFTNITAYTVHYGPVDGGKEEVSPPEPGNSTSVEVTKLLKPFTNYTFYVRLWNNHGASDQSSTITCSTDESVPKTAPKIFVNVISNTKLNVTWKPLTNKQAQGIITEYKLEWRLFKHPSVRVLSLAPDVEEFILTDLMPGEKYDVRVLARTKQGWPNISESEHGWVTVSMPSSNDFIQTEISIFNSSSIKIKWNVKTNSGLQYSSWSVKCKSEDEKLIAAANLTKDLTEYLFTDLETNASYNFELCALNLGEIVRCVSKRADLKRILTSNIPSLLEAVPASSTSINLTWIPGKSNSSNSFEICYIPVYLLNESFTCIPANSTKVMISDLRPFMLYQFKVRALSNDSDDSPFSETIECYTNEDVPGKVEDIEWFLLNSTNVRVAWKEPNNMNGVIQNYFITYTTDTTEPRSAWSNVTVLGNRTATSLPGLVSGKRYFVIIQAATKAGLGTPSEPIIILTGGSNSVEVPSSLDEHKPLPKIRDDKKLGIILGVGISMCFITVCLCSIYCRRKYESLRSLRESAQPLKSRVIARNGNCCVDRSSTPINQPPVISNEFELAVLCPPTPITTNPLCDTKGGHANGVIESKEPLLAPWAGINGTRKDLRITENPQYKSRESENFNKLQKQNHEETPDMNSTQLTTLNYELEDSVESLNNNLGRRMTSDCINDQALPSKTVPIVVPVLEPNG